MSVEKAPHCVIKQKESKKAPTISAHEIEYMVPIG